MLPYPEMSETDYLIIRGLADGGTSKEIAQKTGRSCHTVDSRVKGLCTRFKALSRAQLVASMYELGLLQRRNTNRLDRP